MLAFYWVLATSPGSWVQTREILPIGQKKARPRTGQCIPSEKCTRFQLTAWTSRSSLPAPLPHTFGWPFVSTPACPSCGPAEPLDTLKGDSKQSCSGHNHRQSFLAAARKLCQQCRKLTNRTHRAAGTQPHSNNHAHHHHHQPQGPGSIMQRPAAAEARRRRARFEACCRPHTRLPGGEAARGRPDDPGRQPAGG